MMSYRKSSVSWSLPISLKASSRARMQRRRKVVSMLTTPGLRTPVLRDQWRWQRPVSSTRSPDASARLPARRVPRARDLRHVESGKCRSRNAVAASRRSRRCRLRSGPLRPRPSPDAQSSGDGSHVNDLRSAPRFRHRLTVLAQAFDMKRNRPAHLPHRLLHGCSRRNAAGQIRSVGSGVAWRSLDYDCVLHEFFHSFNPACLMMLAHVPLGRSSLGLPAMVTVPGFSGCRYWRRLPLVRASCHPSRSTRRIASRTVGMERDLRSPVRDDSPAPVLHVRPRGHCIRPTPSARRWP